MGKGQSEAIVFIHFIRIRRAHFVWYSYIEEFWYESYLSHSDPVVLALNPFFVLEYVWFSYLSRNRFIIELGTIPLRIEAPSFLGQHHSLSRLLVSFMTFVPAFLSQTQHGAYHSIWTSTLDFLVQPGFPLIEVAK